MVTYPKKSKNREKPRSYSNGSIQKPKEVEEVEEVES